MRSRKINSDKKASLIAKISKDHKAQDVVVLDLRGLSSVADYFVICGGSSSKTVQSIADECGKAVKDSGAVVHHIEGYREGLWVLLDCGDVVLHAFHYDSRTFYSLEDLWADAPRLTV